MSPEMSAEMRRGLALTQAAAARNLAALASADLKPRVAGRGESDAKEKPTQVEHQDERTSEELVPRPTSKKDAIERAIKADSAAGVAQTEAETAAKGAEKAAVDAAAPTTNGPIETTSLSPTSALRQWLRSRRRSLSEPPRQHAAGQGEDGPVAEARKASVTARNAANRAAALAGEVRAQARKALDATRLSQASNAAVETERLARDAEKQAVQAKTARADAERYRRTARNQDFLPDAKDAVVRALAQVEHACSEMDRESPPNRSRVSDPGAASRATRTRDYLAIEQRALTAVRDVLLQRPASGPSKPQTDEGREQWDGPTSAADLPQEIRDEPQLAYAVACYLVRWRGVPFSDRRVCELLDRAAVVDIFLEFAEDDPELSTAPDKSGFEELRARLAEELERRNKLKAAAETATTTTSES